MQKEIDSHEFVQSEHFDFINSLKNNGTKYLLIFDDSSGEICNSKEFVDIATAGKHRGFSIINIKLNLFHQSELRRDVELQNTHMFFFKSPRDLHHVATTSVHLGLRSALVDWYGDATSVPFGHLLIDLSPRTDHRLRYCTRSGNIPSKSYVPDNLKHLKDLDDEHTESLYPLSIPTPFLRMQNSVSKNLSKRVYPISQRVHRQPAARKLVRSKKNSRPKVRRQKSRTVFKKNNLEATKKSTFVAKRIIAHKNNLPLRQNHSYWDGTIRSSTFFVYNGSNSPTIVTKQELPKYKPEQTPTYQKDRFKKEINQYPSRSVSLLVNKTLESPLIKLSNSDTLILNGIETGVLLMDFAQRLKRKNVPIPDIYFTLPDEASITTEFVVNSHAKGKERGA